MLIRETGIPGCLEITPPVFTDDRGTFVKTFIQDEFTSHGLVAGFAEEYFTVSIRNVLRGLHFQTPPFDHYKIVSCLAGRVLDAVVDLRVGSPAFGRHELFELDAAQRKILYLPPGVAHGFYAVTDQALMTYKVTTAYSSAHDSGVLWSSAGIPWPCTQPVISARDAGFQSLDVFESPFIFHEG